MKTKESKIESTNVSQSEALLGAIHAGFFEIYFDKNKIKKTLSNRANKAIRLRLASWKNGRCAFVAEIINRFGKKSEATVDFAIVQNHSKLAFKNFWSNFKAEFSRRDLSKLLSPKYCVGLRLMPSMKNKSNKRLIAVGVQPGGFDIAEGAGYICGKMA